MKVSDYIVQFVAEQGVKHVFLVTGGGAMHLNDSVGRCEALEAICNSHEQASAICAEVYGKATNNLGVAVVTTGPGGTNAVTGVAGAWLDSTPCLFISGQVKRPDRMFDRDGRSLGLRQLGVQEVDIVSIVKPITKYARQQSSSRPGSGTNLRRLCTSPAAEDPGLFGLMFLWTCRPFRSMPNSLRPFSQTN